jgi:hypothetical protein
VKRDGAGVARPPRDALLHRLWDRVSRHFAEAAARTGEAAAAAGAVRARQDTIERLRESAFAYDIPAAVAWEAPAPARGPGDDIEFSWAGETARHAGTVVHRWLQRIAAEGLDAWTHARVDALRPAIRRALAARGVNEADLEAAAARVRDALHGCLDDPRARWILAPHPEARSEYRLTARLPGGVRSLVIDRMFRDASGRRWIVDYKTSAHEGGELEPFLDRELERYRAQLETYRAAFAGEPVALGLYFPLVKGWREWTP